MKYIKKFDFAQKRGVRDAISQKGLLEFFQNLYQIEAFRSPGDVELSEFTGMDLALDMNCAQSFISSRKGKRRYHAATVANSVNL